MNLANDTRRLVLMRHAKAEPAGAVSDEMRPLALAGRRQANAAGALISELGPRPDKVLVSNALRTRQTWELVSNGLEVDASFAELSQELYLAHPQDVLDKLAVLDDCQYVLVIGHEPTMSALAAHLAGPGTDPALYESIRFGLRTSSFVVLESEDHWSSWGQGVARLVTVDRPELS